MSRPRPIHELREQERKGEKTQRRLQHLSPPTSHAGVAPQRSDERRGNQNLLPRPRLHAIRTRPAPIPRPHRPPRRRRSRQDVQNHVPIRAISGGEKHLPSAHGHFPSSVPISTPRSRTSARTTPKSFRAGRRSVSVRCRSSGETRPRRCGCRSSPTVSETVMMSGRKRVFIGECPIVEGKRWESGWMGGGWEEQEWNQGSQRSNRRSGGLNRSKRKLYRRFMVGLNIKPVHRLLNRFNR